MSNRLLCLFALLLLAFLATSQKASHSAPVPTYFVNEQKTPRPNDPDAAHKEEYRVFRIHQESSERGPAGMFRHQKPLPEVFSDEKVIALTTAAMKGDTAEMDRLVKEGVDVNTIGKEGVTPLLYTQWSNNFKGFLRLLEHKADPNHCWDNAKCAVHYAANHEDTIWLVAVLRHGGNPNTKGTLRFPQPVDRLAKWREPTPLESLPGSRYPYHPSQCTNAALLIAAGADLEAKDADGMRPFESHVRHGTAATAYLILVSGTSLEGEGRVSAQNAVKAYRFRVPDYSKYQKESQYYREKIQQFLEERGIDTTPDPV